MPIQLFKLTYLYKGEEHVVYARLTPVEASEVSGRILVLRIDYLHPYSMEELPWYQKVAGKTLCYSELKASGFLEPATHVPSAKPQQTEAKPKRTQVFLDYIAAKRNYERLEEELLAALEEEGGQP